MSSLIQIYQLTFISTNGLINIYLWVIHFTVLFPFPMSSTIEYLTHSRRPIHTHLHGSAFCRTLSVVQALIHEQLLLTCAPRSLSTTMLWEHHTSWVRLRVTWDFTLFRTRLCVVQGLDSASAFTANLYWYLYFIASQNYFSCRYHFITPIPMSTLNDRLLIGRNPDGMSIFLPLYTSVDLL